MATIVEHPQTPPQTPRKRVASSQPYNVNTEKPAKKPAKKEVQMKRDDYSQPAVSTFHDDIYHAYIDDLSPEQLALRMEWIRKETEERNYFWAHPDELLAKIREEDPMWEGM